MGQTFVLPAFLFFYAIVGTVFLLGLVLHRIIQKPKLLGHFIALPPDKLDTLWGSILSFQGLCLFTLDYLLFKEEIPSTGATGGLAAAGILFMLIPLSAFPLLGAYSIFTKRRIHFHLILLWTLVSFQLGIVYVLTFLVTPDMMSIVLAYAYLLPLWPSLLIATIRYEEVEPE